MRKYRLRIGLDVDDVLYQCNQYAMTLLKDKYGDRPAFDLNNIKKWGRQGDISDERFAMYADPAFVSSQPMYEGAHEFVTELTEIADVFFVTAVPPKCMSARAERLLADFPEVPQSNIIIGTRKDIIHLDMLLDDSAKNIAESSAAHPVLMRRPWNTDLSGLLSVNSYDDFLHLARAVRDSFIQSKPDLTDGGVVCLVGASGTGKTKIARSLTADPRFVKPITSTTRPRHPGDDDSSYCFVSTDEFIKNRDEGKYIETTVYSSFFFGTSAEHITPVVDSGRIAVIPIDICGALTLKNLYGTRAMLVFTDRSTEGILADIIAREIPDDDKIRRIMSLDYEAQNKELCDFAVDYDCGADECADAIKRELGV